MGCSPAGMDCSSTGPLQGHKSCQKTCSSMGSPQGHSLLQAHPPALMWILHGLWVDICSTVVLHHRLHRHHLCSSAWSISSSSFFTEFGISIVVSLTCSHFSLPAAVVEQFLPLLKYVIAEALPPSLMGSALASGESVLELAGTGSVGHGGSFWHHLTEATPAALWLPKPCHVNPILSAKGLQSKPLGLTTGGGKGHNRLGSAYISLGVSVLLQPRRMTSHPPKFPWCSQPPARATQPSPLPATPPSAGEHTQPGPPQSLSTSLIGYWGHPMTRAPPELPKQSSPGEKCAVTAPVAPSSSCYTCSCTLAAGTIQPPRLLLFFFLLFLLPGMWADPEGSCKLHIFQTFVFHNTSFVDISSWATLEDIIFATLQKYTWNFNILYPWVYQALPAAEWENLQNLFRVYMHNFILSMSSDARLYQIPYPFVFQCTTGCDLYPNGSYTKFYHLACNTHDFLSFDVDNSCWERRQESELVAQVERQRNTFTGFSATLQHLLNVTCVEHMKKFIKYGRAALERQGSSKVALSVGITIAVLLTVAATLAGAMWHYRHRS
ncbi:uncharacterized protein LJ206_014270 isoform 2-T2 [Theristicus caerulescens]